MSIYLRNVYIELTKKQIDALQPFFDAVLDAEKNPDKNIAIMGQFFGGGASAECNVVLVDAIAAKKIFNAAKKSYDRAAAKTAETNIEEEKGETPCQKKSS